MLLFLLFYEGDLTNIMHNNWSPCLNKVKLFLKNLRFRLARCEGCSRVDDGHRGLEPEKDCRCALIIPRAWKPPLPSRLSDDYGVIARGALIWCIHAIHPPSEPRVAILCRARFVHWIQQVSLPRSTRGSRTKGSLFLLSRMSFRFENCGAYTWSSNGLSTWRSISHRSFAARSDPEACYSFVLCKYDETV